MQYGVYLQLDEVVYMGWDAGENLPVCWILAVPKEDGAMYRVQTFSPIFPLTMDNGLEELKTMLNYYVNLLIIRKVPISQKVPVRVSDNL
jgi:hypothetical protein